MDSLNTRIDNLDGSIYNVVGNLSGTVENLQKNLNGLQNQITNLSQQFRNHRHGPGRRRLYVYINKKEDETYVDSPNYKHTGHKVIVSEEALYNEAVRGFFEEGGFYDGVTSGTAQAFSTKDNIKLNITTSTKDGEAYSLSMTASYDADSGVTGVPGDDAWLWTKIVKIYMNSAAINDTGISLSYTVSSIYTFSAGSNSDEIFSITIDASHSPPN